jgi:hypothetical protein
MSTETTETTTESAAPEQVERRQQDTALAELGKLRKAMAEMKPKMLSEEEIAEYKTLKSQVVKTEEERAQKAGEFESLKKQWADKHASELADRDAKITKERERRIKKSVDAAFGQLTSGKDDYFSGSENSKTVYDIWTAQRTLKEFVSVEDDDNGDEIVVVKNTRGEVILGRDGNPAPFADAIGELIAQLPNKDRILRGSGKTGSGSSGGSRDAGGAVVVDVRQTQSRGAFSDPKQRAAMRKQMAGAGGLQMGPAWDRTNQ